MPRLRARQQELSPLPRGNLQDGVGTAVGNDAACGNPTANGEEAAAFVEEADVEGEAHAEGVDAGAARDEKPGTGFDAVEIGEPEQTEAESRGDRNL